MLVELTANPYKDCVDTHWVPSGNVYQCDYFSTACVAGPWEMNINYLNVCEKATCAFEDGRSNENINIRALKCLNGWCQTSPSGNLVENQIKIGVLSQQIGRKWDRLPWKLHFTPSSDHAHACGSISWTDVRQMHASFSAFLGFPQVTKEKYIASRIKKKATTWYKTQLCISAYRKQYCIIYIILCVEGRYEYSKMLFVNNKETELWG